LVDSPGRAPDANDRMIVPERRRHETRPHRSSPNPDDRLGPYGESSIAARLGAVYFILARVLKASHGRHIIALLSGVVACLLLGALAFALTQHIPFTTALYWAITTATTVGYGDVLPHNASGRFVASATMLTTIPMLAATFALVTGAAAAAGIRRILDVRPSFPTGSYRLVIGNHPTIPAIMDELAKAHDAVVLVADIDPVKVREGVHCIAGEPTEQQVLRRAHPEGAQHALVAAENDGDVLVIAVLLREMAPNLAISAVVGTNSVSAALKALGVRQTVSVNGIVAHILAKSLETPHASDLLFELVDSEEHRLVEFAVNDSEVGKTLSAVREDRGGLVLAIVHGGTPSILGSPLIQS
jgi:voltage-gated potassium channel